MLDLIVNAAQVFAEDAEENQLHAPHEQHRHQRRRLTQQFIAEQTQNNHRNNAEQTERRHTEPHIGRQLQRQV